MPTEPKALSLREQIARRRTRTPWDALSERGKQDDLAFADEIIALFVARLRAEADYYQTEGRTLRDPEFDYNEFAHGLSVLADELEEIEGHER